MEPTIERPPIVTDDMLEHLDEVRRSGQVSMFSAAPAVAREFGLGALDAKTVVAYWLRTWGQRRKAER